MTPSLSRALLAAAALSALCCRQQNPAPRPSALPVSEALMRGQVESARLVRGFYESNGSWRATARSFAVSLDPPETGQAYVIFDFAIPAELAAAGSPATLVTRVNGIETDRRTFAGGGQNLIEIPVPQAALARRPAEVSFELDRTFRDPQSGRETGVYAVSIALVEYERTPRYKEQQIPVLEREYESLRQRRRSPIPPDKELEIANLLYQTAVFESQWFHGIRILKNPLDLWALQDTIAEVRPDFVIETGTWNGGSALYSASVLNGLGLTDSRVITVDISDYTYSASGDPLWKKYVDFYLGSSTDSEIVGRIAARVKGRKVLVSLDSDHSMRHVLKELVMYSPLVSRGSYIIVEDTNLDGVPVMPQEFPGPFAAVSKFLKDGGERDFERDLSREQSGTSFHPGGWLRRK